jgi:hypothetical protein
MLFNFFGIIYNYSSIFPYDLYSGYTNENVITAVKRFMKLPPVANVIKLVGIIYNSSSIFPYDLY